MSARQAQETPRLGNSRWPQKTKQNETKKPRKHVSLCSVHGTASALGAGVTGSREHLTWLDPLGE